MYLLAKRNNHKEDYYSEKIKDVISYHIDNWQKEYKVNLYLNDVYNTVSILLLDNYAIVSLYREAIGKDTVPYFIFEKNGTEYEKIYNDVMELYKDKSHCQKYNGTINSDKK